MLTIRKSMDRGHANLGWLNSRHTFSFADYHDPKFMGFRSLRVINEDRIQGGTGFARHPHHDMEIISYVVNGALEHEDSMGNKTVIRPGEVQRMSAGTGITHSEYNHSKSSETHFLQIWISPRQQGLAPGYGQQEIESKLAAAKFILAVSSDGRNDSIEIGQDADLYVGRLKASENLIFKIRSGRHVWIQLIRGSLSVNGDTSLSGGDGLAVSDESQLQITAQDSAEFLLFDLA